MQTATMPEDAVIAMREALPTPCEPDDKKSDVEREQRKANDKACAAKATPQGGLSGMLWFTGWLFTIGFAELVWWKALLGLVLWPYFLALALR
jgi:hypothetical protein